jgi:hypothetical protein
VSARSRIVGQTVACLCSGSERVVKVISTTGKTVPSGARKSVTLIWQPSTRLCFSMAEALPMNGCAHLHSRKVSAAVLGCHQQEIAHHRLTSRASSSNSRAAMRSTLTSIRATAWRAQSLFVCMARIVPFFCPLSKVK